MSTGQCRGREMADGLFRPTQPLCSLQTGQAARTLPLSGMITWSY